MIEHGVRFEHLLTRPQLYAMTASLSLLMLLGSACVVEYAFRVSRQIAGYKVTISPVQREVKKISISMGLLVGGAVINGTLIVIKYWSMFHNLVPYSLHQTPSRLNDRILKFRDRVGLTSVLGLEPGKVYNVRKVSLEEYNRAYEDLYSAHSKLKIGEPHPVLASEIMANALSRRTEERGLIRTLMMLLRLTFKPGFRAVRVIYEQLDMCFTLQPHGPLFERFFNAFISICRSLYLHERLEYEFYREFRSVFTMINDDPY